MRATRWIIAPLLALTAWVGGLSVSRAADATAVIETLADSAIALDERHEVSGLTLRTRSASIHLQRGVVYPTGPTVDGVRELVFIGHGRVSMSPPDETEGSQLEIFTGSRTLDARFHQAIFVLTDPGLGAELLATPDTGAENGARREAAQRLWDDWRPGGLRRALGIDAAVLRRGLGESGSKEYFAARLSSRDLGTFFILEDPEETEQVMVGKIWSYEFSKKLKKTFHKAQKQGRWGVLELEDLGFLEIWSRFSHRDDSGRAQAGKAAFEPEHYDIDFHIDGKDQRISGKTTIKLKAQKSGHKTISLQIGVAYQVESIQLQSGVELPFVVNGTEVLAVLPSPSLPGDRKELTVIYSGRPLEKVKKGSFRLDDTQNWYPHVGAVDRATYSARFEWPWWLTLLASGARVDGGQKGSMRWETRRLDIPSRLFGFEMARFDVETVRSGHVTFRFAFDRESQKMSAADRAELKETVVDALEFYESIFGPYPLDELTVSTVPRDFSQGMLGFVTLSTVMIDDLSWSESLFGAKDRRGVIAHEVAHQWWANLVGFASYRDQWLSEAMANFAAMTYSRQQIGGSHSVRRLGLANWDKTLFSTQSGRSTESYGPMTIGARLNSTRAQAYYPVVYMKGALVLDMLSRRFVGEDAFLTMLRHVVKAAANRPVTTEQFIDALERMSGADLASFVDQYIYGTGAPLIYYTYEVEPGEDGRWSLQGEAVQFPSNLGRLRVTADESGRLDVYQDARPTGESDGLGLVLPFTVKVGGDETSYVNGRIALREHRTSFGFELEQEPVEMHLDRGGQVLAVCISAETRPKNYLVDLGWSLRHAGRLDEAVQAFRDAVAEEDLGKATGVASEASQAVKVLSRQLSRYGLEVRIRRPTETERRRSLDLLAYSSLASVYLDQHDLEGARQALVDARARAAEDAEPDDSGSDSDERTLTLLEARLALQEGRHADVTEQLVAAMEKLDLEESAMARALLAAAARGAGDEAECRKWADKARSRNVDVSLLERPPARAATTSR